MFSLCTALCSHSFLTLAGFTQPFQTENDAINNTVDGILMQEDASVHKPIALSRMILKKKYEKL